MKRQILHSIAVSMALLLFLGQVGLNIHRLYCACKGQWQTAFYQPEDLCRQAHAQVKTLPACCAAAQKNCHQPETGPGELHDCSARDIQYLQQSIPGLEVQNNEPRHQLPVFVAQLPVFAPARPPVLNSIPPLAPKPPPNPYGMELRSRLQSFLC